MKNYQVFFAPEAEEQLLTFIAISLKKPVSDTAQRYTEGIISYCESPVFIPGKGKSA